MAVDTENKRRAAGLHHTINVDPVPDGLAFDKFDRAHLTWIYPDHIAEGAAVEPFAFLDALQCIMLAYDPVRRALRVHEVT